MDFALNDEQKMLIDTVRRFIAEQLQPLEGETFRKRWAAAAARPSIACCPRNNSATPPTS